MKRILWLVPVVALLSCGQDPYGGKKVSGAPPQQIVPEKPNSGAFGLQIQDIMQFSEGAKGEHIVKATVPNPGKAVLQFRNLPAGVHYDSVKERLIWTPDYKAANDPSDPAILMRNYIVDVALFSSVDMSNAGKVKQVFLTVVDTPMPAGVKSPLEASGREGQRLIHQIDFEDQEYPAGPFEIALSGLPLDVSLDWPDRRVPSFKLLWTPAYDKILNKKTEDFSGHIQIFNPRGKRLDFNVRWAISNQTVAPQTSGPTNVAQPGDVDFIVMAEDLNGEAAPTWDVPVRPPYGFLSISTMPITGPGHPKSTGIVSWKAIPKDKLGIVQVIQMQACVQTFSCTTHRVTVLPMASVLSEGAKR